MAVPDHLTCLLRNLYAGQEATVRTGHGTLDGFKLGKGVYQGCVLLPCLFNFYEEYVMQNAGLENSAVATGLENVSFHSNPKERQCQRVLKLPHNCTHLTC